MELLVAKGIHKRFGGLQALTALDISVVENTIHSVIGPNGAGTRTRAGAASTPTPTRGTPCGRTRNATGDL